MLVLGFGLTNIYYQASPFNIENRARKRILSVVRACKGIHYVLYVQRGGSPWVKVINVWCAVRVPESEAGWWGVLFSEGGGVATQEPR